MNTLQPVLERLVELWLWDVSVFSEPWLYWTFVPAIFFFVFFILKWLVLLAPLWLPIVVVINAVRQYHTK